ncbi:ATP synthase F(0) complex subunit C2, mitochondrial-like [Lontra canadensis]|uniref:ATP synthase F(0) complex subunit C2, mitochondrial-like n=1 Tax=Lontra canadensis TaxID=76717 RepID=UPI0013F33202|nr:ATP synthase F(0) complex subunit C2, mitochondrial-like [Lontra canadensis]
MYTGTVCLHPLLGRGHLSALSWSPATVVLKPLETPYNTLSSLTAPRPLTSLIPSHSFPPRAIASDINTAAKFTGAGAAMVRGLAPGLTLGLFGSLVIAYGRNPSLKQQLFSCAVLGFALLEAIGIFCLLVAFLILLTM